jgi:phosphatidylglycerophosphate synthase
MAKEYVGMPDDEYNDVIYRYTYYALQGIAPRIPKSIHPNQITWTAFLCSSLSCILLYWVQTPAAYLWWVLFNSLWYIFDALDGMHARISGQKSEFGGFLDHFLDNVFFTIMFTVFVMKFDLMYPFYIFIILFRFTMCTVVFLVQNHTGKMYLTKFSGGGELLFMTTVMILSYCFPYFNLLPYIHNPTLLSIATWLHLDNGVFMKLILVCYIFGMTPNMVQQYRFARKELCSKTAE